MCSTHGGPTAWPAVVRFLFCRPRVAVRGAVAEMGSEPCEPPVGSGLAAGVLHLIRAPHWDYPELMTRDEAMAEVERRRAADPGASWIATQRDGDWIVARVGLAPTKVTGTATKPPPVAPRDDPHSATERATLFGVPGL
jgi:hypothetical protein